MLLCIFTSSRLLTLPPLFFGFSFVSTIASVFLFIVGGRGPVPCRTKFTLRGPAARGPSAAPVGVELHVVSPVSQQVCCRQLIPDHACEHVVYRGFTTPRACSRGRRPGETPVRGQRVVLSPHYASIY